MAAAATDESHSKLPRKNTGGSDALCLGAPPVQGKPWHEWLARMFYELMSRDHKDGRATGQPQGVGSEAYLNGTSQETTPEDARKDEHIQGRSKQFMKDPGS